MKKLLILFAAAILLAGCKAKEVELRISTEELQEALAGESVEIRFIARFENFGTLDDEKRGQLDSIQAIVEAQMDVDDYNVVSDSSKTTVTVEGSIPVHVGLPGTHTDPFALYIWEVNNELLPGFSHAIQLGIGETFAGLEASMKKISYMLAIDAVQPVMYRLRANSGDSIPVLAGGGQLDGASFSVRAFSVADGERINLTFKGGAYESIYGGLLLALPKP